MKTNDFGHAFYERGDSLFSYALVTFLFSMLVSLIEEGIEQSSVLKGEIHHFSDSLQQR
eukprot:m.123404 g.123404  ORF g.123404 m.123404 type:complete len:59 (+) comp9408_c0_seq2:3416-3592(+)